MTLTDEEIRVKVAELMGWVSCFLDNPNGSPHTGPCGVHPRNKLNASMEFMQSLPDYLNDPASALQLCDRMHSEGWAHGYERYPDDDYIFDFRKDGLTFRASDPSLARAVTLCFLAAHS